MIQLNVFTANLESQYINMKVKNVCFAKFKKYYKIFLQLIKYASQFMKC